MKNLNKVISGVLISSLLFTPVSTLALTKEETVYTNLNYDGTVENCISYVDVDGTVESAKAGGIVCVSSGNSKIIG